MSYLELAKRAERKLGRRSHVEAPHLAADRNLEPEALTAKILAEFEPHDAERICRVWRDIMGFSLNPERVREHLEALKRWKGRWQEESRR